MTSRPPILVVAPHPMDEILGCGGSMALLADAGHDVHIVVLFGTGGGADAGRRDACINAASDLGAQRPAFAGFPENASDTVPLGDVIGIVEDRLRQTEACMVMVSHGGNLYVDHQTAFRAAVTAVRPAPGARVQHVLTYEIPSSTDWATPGFDAPFRPTTFFDIEAALDRKIGALSHPGADCRAWPHARSIEAVRNVARGRGVSVGLPAAEAFMAERQIGDPTAFAPAR